MPDRGHTDVDGDGRADFCARGAAGFWCRPSTGDGFDDAWTLDLSDEWGWDDETNYATFRFGDLDGDGDADLCGRGAAAPLRSPGCRSARRRSR